MRWVWVALVSQPIALSTLQPAIEASDKFLPKGTVEDS